MQKMNHVRAAIPIKLVQLRKQYKFKFLYFIVVNLLSPKTPFRPVSKATQNKEPMKIVDFLPHLERCAALQVAGACQARTAATTLLSKAASAATRMRSPMTGMVRRA